MNWEWTDDRTGIEWTEDIDLDTDTVEVRATTRDGARFSATAPKMPRTRKPVPAGPWCWRLELPDGRTVAGEVSAEAALDEYLQHLLEREQTARTT